MNADTTYDASVSLEHPARRALALVTTTFRPGALIGARYQVVRYLARGGMGEVYEARDLELELPVAIKTIRAERLGDGSSVERLQHCIDTCRLCCRR